MKDNHITQYYSKWRNEWVEFKNVFGNSYIPNEIEIKEMLKFHYQLR